MSHIVADVKPKRVSGASSLNDAGEWENKPCCDICGLKVGKRYLRPRHHCRRCARCVCGSCSRIPSRIDSEYGAQRICTHCRSTPHISFIGVGDVDCVGSPEVASAECSTATAAPQNLPLPGKAMPLVLQLAQAETVVTPTVAPFVVMTPTAAPVVEAVANPTNSVLESGTFLVEQLGRVPFVGGYGSQVLQSRYLQPITKRVDPYVQGAVQKSAPYVQPYAERASPYVKGVVTRATPYVEGAVTRATPIVQTIREAPGQVVQSIRAAPGQVYQTAAEVPGRVYQTTAAVSGQVYQTAAAVPGRIMDTATSTVQTIASVPSRVIRASIDTATSTVQSIRAAPGRIVEGAYNTTALLGISAATRAQPYAISAANLAQPYVHHGVGILIPYVESTLTNQRLQSLYQSQIVQGSIKRATPYVEPVVTNPGVQGTTAAVIEWGRPRANTDPAATQKSVTAD